MQKTRNILARRKMSLGEYPTHIQMFCICVDDLSSCSLRSEKDPYMGMIDCAKQIIQEEGHRTLYRAWWLTLLGGLGGAFS